MAAGSTSVVYELDPRVDVTVLYQRYYLMALEESGSLSLEGEPPALSRLGRPSQRIAVRARATRVRRRLPRSAIRPDSGHVGRYRTAAGVRFMIDARDSAWIDEELVASADVYFKANARPDHAYPPHVLPIVNGDGHLGRRRIERLRRLRDREKAVDLTAIVRLWGSDHEVRVFEELARLDCTKRLLAVFAADYPADRAAEHRRRLERAGVPWTTRALRAGELWKALGEARLVFARPGRHRCWPWRTIDLLCMGAAVVFDELPPPRWPVPLEAGAQVASCGLVVPADRSEADEPEYAKLGATLRALLGDADRVDSLGRQAAAYFDAHADPAAVGRYVRSTVER